MKIQLLSFVCLLAAGFNAQGQGFPNANINWNLPPGGKLSGGNATGFNTWADAASSGDNTGSQTWAVTDINGDSRPDLVITAQLQGGQVTCFSPGLNAYWQVYLNTGNGFATSSIQWALPAGGKLKNAIIYGFDAMSGSAAFNDQTGSQSWSTVDMNGDNKPDLVVTGQLQGGNVTCFSPGAGQYWKVYLNTGTGFAATAINWDLPNGGKLSSGVTYGFNTTNGMATSFDNTGSQSWSLTDLDGDNKPDLVIAAQQQGGQVTCFSPGSGQYWKVHMNTGTGFNTTPVNWSLPVGGKLNGGNTFGFDGVAGIATSSHNTGSQSWSLVDIDGDKKAELVVTAQQQGGKVTCFSPGSGQYWKVYDNTGTGFSPTSINWNLPNGGRLSGGNTYGFDNLGGVAFSGDNTGSQSWIVMDFDGGGKPELVVTAQLQGGNVTCFAPGNNPYWKVYANTSTGFDSSPITCNLPIGGKMTGGVTYGFDMVGGSATSSDNTGSQNWNVTDIDGDHICDLIVTGQLQGGLVTSFSPQSGQYWKVYKSDFVAGISKNSAAVKTFELFPNPNNGTFLVRGNTQEKIQVSNELGQVVRELSLDAANGFTAEISGLETGVYFVNGTVTRTKVVVLN